MEDKEGGVMVDHAHFIRVTPTSVQRIVPLAAVSVISYDVNTPHVLINN